jgi:hypothetical protein
MRFLIDEGLPTSAVHLLREYGHEAVHVNDLNLRGAGDDRIAAHAQRENLCIIAADLDFSDIRNYPPEEYRGLVVLRVPRSASGAFISSLIQYLIESEHVLTQLPGRLAIVEPGRIRMWPEGQP